MTIDDSTSINAASPDHTGHSEGLTEKLDCGDGVPFLTLERPAHESRPFPAEDDRRPHITAKTFAIGATAAGQLMIALSVAAGGSAIVGLFASATLLVCGIGIISTEVVNPRQ